MFVFFPSSFHWSHRQWPWYRGPPIHSGFQFFSFRYSRMHIYSLFLSFFLRPISLLLLFTGWAALLWCVRRVIITGMPFLLTIILQGRRAYQGRDWIFSLIHSLSLTLFISLSFVFCADCIDDWRTREREKKKEKRLIQCRGKKKNEREKMI